MAAIDVLMLSVGAAMVCAMLRAHRPEIATLFSLAVGVTVLWMLKDALSGVIEGVRQFLSMSSMSTRGASEILKATGLSILCELGVQICSDAGESALAGRIRLACRIAVLGMAMPFMMEIFDCISSIGG